MKFCKELKYTNAMLKPYTGESEYIEGVGSFKSVEDKGDYVEFVKNCEAKDLLYRNEVYMQYILVGYTGKPVSLLAMDGTVIFATHKSYNDWLDTLSSTGKEVSRMCASCELLTSCKEAKEFLSIEPLTLKSMRDRIKLLSTLETLETAKIRTMLEQGEEVDGYSLSIKVGKNGKEITSVLINE